MAADAGADQARRFEREDLTGARFQLVDLSASRFDQVRLDGAVMRGVELVGARIDGEVVDLVINGVDVAPLIDAELDRRDPDRRALRPTSPDGFRAAWDLVGRRWDETVARARRLDDDLLHTSVDGEWSFIQTLRHLVFATDVWVRRALLGERAPWHPLDLPHDTFQVLSGVPRDLDTRPSLDEVLALREDRRATVRQVLSDLTVDRLDERTTPVDAPGYPPPDAYPVRECLLIVIGEEWHHRLYAERDLAVLEARASAG